MIVRLISPADRCSVRFGKWTTRSRSSTTSIRIRPHRMPGTTPPINIEPTETPTAVA